MLRRRPTNGAVLAGAALAAAASGCGWIAGLGDEVELADGGVSSSAAGSISTDVSNSTGASTSTGPSGGPCTCGQSSCGTCPEEPMVMIAVAGSPTYHIDATEVTRADYQAFLDANPNTQMQIGTCAWNRSFGPASNSDCTGFDLATYPNRPASCVNWCDAFAYCAWAGRHLCGAIGGGGLDPGAGNDAAQSEWYRACTKNGTRDYPYGSTFDPMACNTAGGPGAPLDVATHPQCVGGYDGLFDMSGNVAEWEDRCGLGVDESDPSDDNCALRGGAFWTMAADSRCDGAGQNPTRRATAHDWGFRCCN